MNPSSILSITILLSLITIHELGHFLAAIYFSVPVEEFAIGMGPSVFVYEGKWAKYTLRLLPVGGYVAIKGLMGEDEKEEKIFKDKRFHEKASIVLGGIVMNFLTAVVIFFAIYNIRGHLVKSANSYIVTKTDNLEVGDRIISINGRSVDKWEDVVAEFEEGKFFKLKISRDGKKEYLGVDVDDIKSVVEGAPYEKSFSKSIYRSFGSLIINIRRMVYSLFNMATGRVERSLVGPIGIIKSMNKSLSLSFIEILLMVAMISINLGVINLIPIPGLDGGHLLFAILYALNIRINKKVEQAIQFIGVAILVYIFLYITRRDIFK